MDKKTNILILFILFFFHSHECSCHRNSARRNLVGQVSVLDFTNGLTVSLAGSKATVNSATAGQAIQGTQGANVQAGVGTITVNAASGDDRVVIGKEDGESYSSMDVSQKDTASTKPVISLTQYATTGPFINFSGVDTKTTTTSVVESSTATAAKTHAVKVLVDGITTGWIRVYDGPE